MKKNAQEILVNVNKCIEELEGINSWMELGAHNGRIVEKGYSGKNFRFNIFKICDELSIFDWFDDYLSLSQLKQMKKFLETAIDLGFTGYVCFKVGAKYCAHGMWAHKKDSVDGHSPDGDVLFHSFRSGDNYFDMKLNDIWMHDKYKTDENPYPDFTLKQVKAELKEA